MCENSAEKEQSAVNSIRIQGGRVTAVMQQGEVATPASIFHGNYQKCSSSTQLDAGKALLSANFVKCSARRGRKAIYFNHNLNEEMKKMKKPEFNILNVNLAIF